MKISMNNAMLVMHNENAAECAQLELLRQELVVCGYIAHSNYEGSLCIELLRVIRASSEETKLP